MEGGSVLLMNVSKVEFQVINLSMETIMLQSKDMHSHFFLNSIEENPSQETDRRSAGQEIPHI